MFAVVFAPLVVIGAVTAAVLRHRHQRVEPDRFLRAVALSLVVVFSGFAGLFIIGETVEDPGGGAAAVLVAFWLVPLAALVLLTVRWPDAAVWVLAALVGVCIAVGGWYAVAPDTWRDFEDANGPVRALGVFALTLPLALLAWRRPVAGGAFLVVLGTVPGLLAWLGAGAGAGGAGSAAVAVALPTAIAGLLFLGGAWAARRRVGGSAASERAGTHPGSARGGT